MPRDGSLFELHAQICQALANATRLEILDTLRRDERSVGELAALIGIREANVSQHLMILRAKGLVIARRDGQTVYYRLASHKVTQACDLMREVLLERLKQSGRLAHAVRRRPTPVTT
jgi:ArsR family transcriptional regulator